MVRDGIYYGLGLSAAGIVLSYGLGAIWGMPFLLLAAFCMYFFRDPERPIPAGPVAVSPADGKVVQVRRLEDGGQRVSIFLNIFNVHVNRVPVSGQVTAVEYRRGRFHMAHQEQASVENEQNTLTIQAKNSCVVVSQIAGLIARRIVCHKRPGDRVEKGERFGLIKFGSRLDVSLGPEWEIAVSSGDKVKGGSSILARRRTET